MSRPKGREAKIFWRRHFSLSTKNMIMGSGGVKSWWKSRDGSLSKFDYFASRSKNSQRQHGQADEPAWTFVRGHRGTQSGGVCPDDTNDIGDAKRSERHQAASWQERKPSIPSGNAKLLLDVKAGSDVIDVVEPTPSPSLQEKRKMMLTRQKESISQ